MPVPEDEPTRRRILSDFDTTFVVEAAAGTGKTTVLVDRIVALVRLGHARLSEIIAVTFTEKAAGEMKLRLRARLERAREAAHGEEKEALTLGIEELEVARINTIHGLCADVLREYPVEAGVDPLFAVAAEGDAQAMLSTAFRRCWADLLQQQPEGVRRALRRRQRGPDAEPAYKVLLGAAQLLVERRDFAAPWRRDPFVRDTAADAVIDALKPLASCASQVRLKGERSEFLECIKLVQRFLDDLSHRESVSPRDYDGLEAQLSALASHSFLWASKPWGLQWQGGLTEADAVARRERAWQVLREFNQQADADLAALLHQELQVVVQAYQVEKERAGTLDFVDLLLLTRDLLQRNVGARQSLQQRFTRVFVDEFQDTDPLQSEIVLLLAADDAAVSEPFTVHPIPGKLFLVGDPKQSIYRFRRADILLYQRVKAHLLHQGAEVQYLSSSFRSTPAIQALVNAAFEPVMTGEHQATYVPLRPWRAPSKERPSLVALPAPQPFNAKGRVTKEAIEASVPQAVAGFIHWLVKSSGWKVEEGGQQVPVQPRHVCILFKRLRRWGGVDVPRPYATALEALRVPHVLVGGRSYHAREEVMALRTALMAVERPDDELSVFATLRGPFFAFTDEQLLVFKSEWGKLHPLRPWADETLTAPAQEVAQALELLGQLHRRRNQRSAAVTIQSFLEATRAQAGVAFWAAGAQALANVLQLSQLARRIERRAGSFREVVERLHEDAEEGEAPEAPLVEEGTEGVRMMTVHAAKGLEFPVVVLAEPTANAARREPSHWVDPARNLWVHALAQCLPSELREHEAEVLERDGEEAIRLAYVAATRARDLLVIPVCGERQWKDDWTQVFKPALWPRPGLEHEGKPAPGCPPFGFDTIVDRAGPVLDQVPVPGLHVASTRTHAVAWWDPNTLKLGVEESTGLEAIDALQDDPVEGPKSEIDFATWQSERERSLAKGVVPSERVCVARELPPMPGSSSISVEMTDAVRAGRASGRRFGELVHACLEVVSFAADATAVSHVVISMGRALNATSEELRAAQEAVFAALRHPRIAAALRATDVRREVAIIDHLEDGTAVEGAIDLAYELDGVWHVVEFKTDAGWDELRLAQYGAQTQAYVRAISAATGKPTRGVILRV